MAPCWSPARSLLVVVATVIAVLVVIFAFIDSERSHAPSAIYAIDAATPSPRVDDERLAAMEQQLGQLRSAITDLAAEVRRIQPHGDGERGPAAAEAAAPTIVPVDPAQRKVLVEIVGEALDARALADMRRSTEKWLRNFVYPFPIAIDAIVQYRIDLKRIKEKNGGTFPREQTDPGYDACWQEMAEARQRSDALLSRIPDQALVEKIKQQRDYAYHELADW
jgi:hypothetical protein